MFVLAAETQTERAKGKYLRGDTIFQIDYFEILKCKLVKKYIFIRFAILIIIFILSNAKRMEEKRIPAKMPFCRYHQFAICEFEDSHLFQVRRMCAARGPH
jgi:hypothetical protein